MASKNSTKKQQIQQNKNTSALSKAKSVDIGSSLSAISATSVKIQGDLAKISEELIQKHAELQAVDEAIAVKKQEMENLHGVDNVLLTIDEARALHMQQLDEMRKQRQELEQQFQDLQAQREQERVREEEEYNYKLSQQRKADSDAWTEQVRVRGNQERDRREAFEKDIAARDAALKMKEAEYQAALTKAATFDDDVKKEVTKAEAILRNTLTKDFNHEKQITAVQHAAQVEKLQFDNKRLVEAANNYENQVRELNQQLKEAYAKNNELAAKAVEAANNKQAQADALALVTNIGTGNGTRART